MCIRDRADILFIGIFGGFYIVPLYALIQARTDEDKRARVIAANNILNALFMVAAALVSILFISDRARNSCGIDSLATLRKRIETSAAATMNLSLIHI